MGLEWEWKDEGNKEVQEDTVTGEHEKIIVHGRVLVKYQKVWEG